MSEKSRPSHVNSSGLMPPGRTADASAGPAQRHTLLWLSLGAVLLIGLAVVLLLPKLVGPPPPNEQAAGLVIPRGADTQSVANELMQGYLQLHAGLLLENAPVWGEPRWSEAEQQASLGARRFAQHKFSAAATHYAAAIESLQHLEGGREQRLDEVMALANEALDNNELIRAIEYFEQVLSIDPEHEAAQYDLGRAHTRIAVLDAMAIGEQAEARGDLPAAQVAYQEAALLEPGYEPPAQAFQRVTDALESQAFNKAMSIALITLKAGRFDRAAAALADARALRPNDPALLDAEQRLAQAQQQSQMARYRRQATNMTRAENWKGVIAVYKKALAVDAGASFALGGLDKAEARLALNQQFDHYLNKPDRLYDTAPLANARELLSTVTAAPPEEPRLAKKIRKLQALVTGAETPVTVTLSSDGETEVSIYHVGNIGFFTNYQIELLPGDYTVVGSCYGYRDVHKQLKVVPGRQDAALKIRCEELI